MSQPVLLRDVVVFDGERILDGGRDVLVKDGRVAVVARAGSVGAPARTIHGGAALPGVVDAHVHVTFSTAQAIVTGGVTAALDLGAPLRDAFIPRPPLRLRAAGPLLTAPGGYPTTSWGANGYGLEIASASAAREAVATLADRGAAMVKVAIAAAPSLDDEMLAAVVHAAHARGLAVAAHALTRPDVVAAVDAGVDVLAHTPVDPLGDEVIKTIGRRGMTVISTVRAFGAAASTRDNLAALVSAGCPVVYGSDLGNEGIAPGIDPAELAILAEALGGTEAALRAATSGAAGVAGFPPARIHPGEAANLIVCEGLEFAMLRRPSLVFIDGKEIAVS